MTARAPSARYPGTTSQPPVSPRHRAGPPDAAGILATRGLVYREVARCSGLPGDRAPGD